MSESADKSASRASASLFRISVLGAIIFFSYFLILESAVLEEKPTFSPNSF